MSTTEVADRAGYKDARSASLLRENLLRKDLIYSPRRGVVAFTVPLFAVRSASSFRLPALRASSGGLLLFGFLCEDKDSWASPPASRQVL